MIRTIAWIVAIAIIVAVSFWFADQPGAVSLSWRGWRVDTSVAFLVLCAGVLSAVIAILYRAWVATWHVPKRWLAFRRARRRERGYRALTEGMVAVAAGDAAAALRQAKRADGLLGDPPLTMLLSAQAAQLDGDDDSARAYFDRMLERPETAFLGLRGLLMQAQRSGDEAAALDYARRAYQLRPKTAWVLTTLFDLEVRHGDWTGARRTLEEAVRQRAMTPEEGREKRVVVLLGCSAEAGAAGDGRQALAHAKKAHDEADQFLPATLRLVGLMIGQDKKRAASRIIHNTWQRHPHPELARLYLSMFEGEEPSRLVHRVERLAAFNPDHAESRIALAEATLAAGDWSAARAHLEKAASGSDQPSARVCRLMAELEEAESGNIEAARQWLLKAAAADPDPSWMCTSCGAAWAHWSPICGRCDALGSLDWRTPERARDALASTILPPDPKLPAAADPTGVATIPDAEAEDAETDDADDDAAVDARPDSDEEAEVGAGAGRKVAAVAESEDDPGEGEGEDAAGDEDDESFFPPDDSTTAPDRPQHRERPSRLPSFLGGGRG